MADAQFRNFHRRTCRSPRQSSAVRLVRQPSAKLLGDDIMGRWVLPRFHDFSVLEEEQAVAV